MNAIKQPVYESSEVAASPIEPTAPMRALTFRSVGVSLLLAAVFGYFIPIVDFKFSNTFLGSMHMPAGAIAVLLALLLVVNPLLRVLSARASFQRNEVLTVYITCLFSTLVPGRGSESFFVPNVLSSFYFATRDNDWLNFLTPYLKPWMTPAVTANSQYNPTAVEGWYVGGQAVPWSLWLMPVLAWAALILSVQVMHGCLAVMLRAQWAQREALAFPLLRLPLDMTEDTDEKGGKIGAFFRNPLVWVGAAIAFFIEMLNGLNLYYPEVPAFPLGLNTGQFLTEAPWNQLGPTQMQVFPAIVGISFLLTSEVSFSLWFFHIFSKMQYVGSYMMGYPPASLDAPFWLRGWAKGFIGYQQVGAILAYTAILVWLGREHWKYIARRAIGRERATDEERREALSYPIAFWGFIAALTFIIGWTVASGVSIPVAVLMWAFYLAVCLALTRLVAEAGLLFVQTGWMPLGPLAFLFGAGPGRLVDAVSGPPASMISSSLMLDMRGFLLPSFLHGFKLAHDRRIPARPLLVLITACILVSFTIGVVTVLNLGHSVGGLQLAKWWATAAGSQPALHAVGFAKGFETNYAGNWFWVAVGGLATWGMMAARSRFTWFPFHPLGLIMCVPFAMHAMWISIFLGWMFKVLITRFGGSDAYRKMIPLFLGIVVGDIVMILFWLGIDGWQGRTGHALLPF
ncbi:MAG TPA: DUF6785 family protein [Abditibacteriaceae bacterium]|jgi:hypothetical protein